MFKNQPSVFSSALRSSVAPSTTTCLTRSRSRAVFSDSPCDALTFDKVCGSEGADVADADLMGSWIPVQIRSLDRNKPRNGERSVDVGKLANMAEVKGNSSEPRATGILSDEVDESLDTVDGLQEAVRIRIVRPLESVEKYPILSKLSILENRF